MKHWNARHVGFGLLLVGVLVCGCGETAVPEKEASEDAGALPASEGVVLSTARHAVQAPIDDGAILVEVTADGEIRVDGEGPLSMAALRLTLAEATASPEWREPDMSSRRSLRLRVDQTVPWVVSQWLMQTAAHPTVGIWRIDVAVLDASGAAGVLPIRLPKDRGITATAQFLEELPMVTARVFRKRDEDGSAWTRVRVGDQESFDLRADATREGTLDAVRRAIEALRSEIGKSTHHPRAEIKAPRPSGLKVPHGDVMAVYDAFVGAGDEDWARGLVQLEGIPLPLARVTEDVEALKDYVAELQGH